MRSAKSVRDLKGVKEEEMDALEVQDGALSHATDVDTGAVLEVPMRFQSTNISPNSSETTGPGRKGGNRRRKEETHLSNLGWGLSGSSCT